MAGIAVAESKESPRKGRKTLHHIEIHPKMGGGHIVKHMYSGDGPTEREYHFGEDEGERAAAHIGRHAHLPQLGGTPETEEEIAEAPMPETHPKSTARKEKKPVKAEGSMHENARDAHYEGE